MSAIALDVTSVATVASASSLTWSHTCTGTDLLLIVAVGVNNNADTDIITGITYNGVALTKINRKFLSGMGNASLWYLVAPSTGANNIIVSTSPSAGIDGVGASYTGCQTTQPDATTVASASINGFTQSTTTIQDKAWMLWAVMNDGGPTASMSAGGTLRQVGTQTTLGYGDSNGLITPAASYSMSAQRTPPGLSGWVGVQASIAHRTYPPLSMVKGSFALTGENASFLKAHGYVLGFIKGSFAVTGQLLNFLPPLWTKQTKSPSTFTNQPKSTP